MQFSVARNDYREEKQSDVVGVPSPMTIAVIGLGKIGLPLAAQFASKEHTVIGCDLLRSVVDAVNAGRSHINEEADLADAVANAVAAGRLTATTDTTGAVASADVIVVIVPLIVDAAFSLDFRALDQATHAVARGLRPGALVIFETTVPVGTTSGRLREHLERGSGLVAGRDFFVAFSPERVWSGRIFADLRQYPKIVGGIDSASGARAVAFYRAVLDADVLLVSNTETAEFSKLAETTYRDVNIALANQLARYADRHGVDAMQAFLAANTQPTSHLHTPGMGVGGHCIPVYPHFLLYNGIGEELSLVREGRIINDAMAGAAVDRLEDILGTLHGKRVLVLGLAYRQNVKELAFSVALRLIEQLKRREADVVAHDPLFSPDEVAKLGIPYADIDDPRGLPVDAIVLQAYHAEYHALDWSRFPGVRAVFDGRGVLDQSAIRDCGAEYLAFGRLGTGPSLSSDVNGPELPTWRTAIGQNTP